jgi:hypothetical protein
VVNNRPDGALLIAVHQLTVLWSFCSELKNSLLPLSTISGCWSSTEVAYASGFPLGKPTKIGLVVSDTIYPQSSAIYVSKCNMLQISNCS